jgi:hypothetical protein
LDPIFQASVALLAQITSDLEGAGIVFLGNAVELLPDYMASHPRRQYLSSQPLL